MADGFCNLPISRPLSDVEVTLTSNHGNDEIAGGRSQTSDRWRSCSTPDCGKVASYSLEYPASRRVRNQEIPSCGCCIKRDSKTPVTCPRLRSHSVFEMQYEQLIEDVDSEKPAKELASRHSIVRASVSQNRHFEECRRHQVRE